ncbi:hypothetical protein CRM22_002890 [Opisthorchis felineus]|uniref:GPI mannosyltransferase 2 n=1 Tax=Opisthorchis felineus TaxID=147828 RepID=A0A4S2M3W3_OPIFE|nr:hypothetical protein CRM22_002890 [Opisthorchis felineus]TGZ70976.1 hypothetical protein CRM22_002890 [Opisthorchis felineus]
MNFVEKRLLSCCLQVRLLLLLLQILVSPFPDHDADAFHPPNGPYLGQIDALLSQLFRGSKRWDSIYFCFIAQWGYVYEQSLAFFPFLPILLGSVARLIYPIVGILLSLDTAILLVGMVINLACTLFATLQLYRLSLELIGSEKISYVSALLFCVNPASIFFSSIYSESLYFTLTLLALRLYERNRLFPSALLFALTAACRSNGLVNCGYLGYGLWCSLVSSSRLWSERVGLNEVHGFAHLLRESFCWWSSALSLLIPYLFLGLLCVLPFIVYQAYGYYLFCSPLGATLPAILPEPAAFVIEHGIQMGYRLPYHLLSQYPQLTRNHTTPAWCSSDLPFSYSHIQREFWSVGFLGYFHWKQLPNFLLAIPVILLSLSCASSFYSRAPKAYRTLGVHAESARDRQLVPYVLHLLFLTVYGVSHINVQVLTRLIFSSCPMIYWYCAYLVYDSPQWQLEQGAKSGAKCKKSSVKTPKSTWHCEMIEIQRMYNPLNCRTISQCVILTYFLGYTLLGTVLHSKFLPWT